MRKLTGKWYLKKAWWGYKSIMVEVVKTCTCDYDQSESPEFTTWEKARPEDIPKLGINVA